MKEMSKKKIIDKKSIKSILNERDLLARMNHPFIVNMHFAFQDNDNVYLVMDLLKGGDLRYHLCYHGKYTEEETKFIIANIILGLEYIHSNMILHRDIKPENLVFNTKGYVKITDFGIAKIYEPNNKTETSGTPGYMAPEVICCQNHTISVDYFALGVIAYEMMIGHRPYVGKSRKEIKEKIMSKQVKIGRTDIPNGWSIEAADFINKLIQRKPSNRLGAYGIQEIKAHPWMKYYVWKDVYLEKVKAPFTPSTNMEENFDSTYCNVPERIGINTQERYNKIGLSDYYKTAFTSYFYYNRYIMLEKFKEQFFKNPHQIYSDLEAKEAFAFSHPVDEKGTKKRNGRTQSLNEKGFNSVLSNNSLSNCSTGRKDSEINKKHRKNVKSVQY